MNASAGTPHALERFRAALRESPPLFWSFLYFFCLLSGYYVLRPVREAMGASADVQAIFPPAMIEFFAARGMALKDFTLQVLFTCTFIIMLLLQPAYGWLVSRYPRRVFLPAVYGFFIATLLVFYVLFDSGVPGRGMAFFLWITVFNLFAVAVFWSFMADVYSNAEARRYYGYIGAAGTIGAILGPILTRTFVERIGIANLMLVSAGFLFACIVCLLRLRLWAVAREQERRTASGEVPMGGEILAGLKLVAREPLLRWMAVLVVMGVGVGTLLYNEQAAIVRKFYPDAQAATAYYASIDLAVNALTLTVQLLVTRWLMSRFGIAPALLIPGAAIILGYAVLSASPLPMIVAIVQVVTRSSEFCLAKPARETIYTRVGREWRYKAGAAIDTVVYRGGDLSFVWLHKLLSAFGSNVVFGAGLLIAAGMTFGAWRLLREESKLPSERAA
ncbi:NTP/NDP exchange transporter [Pseudoxanthomonas wuyuanensis]|uniref:ATP:ADP antiporter, AAA family n=1 Tax=Pseudoxanthomonas wuyuanensis TaxID=1073196 RepID=A0A286D465_9GAMM|nr:MFS transporter [Pseudoxanthomonas wuyuanensis]KAF1719368.1 MFS transporter [Pseudoxanthomonas wuyuanensis]SOD53435.1 ATP:ADP antiporter, AAA family [Pseudoxanthomonas wuyuanensis]